MLYLMILSCCVVNNYQTLTGHDLRCEFWCILHQQVHGLASLLIPMTIFRESKGWDSESAIFNRWCPLLTMAFKMRFPIQSSIVCIHVPCCTGVYKGCGTGSVDRVPMSLAGISGSVVGLWWYIPTPASTYQIMSKGICPYLGRVDTLNHQKQGIWCKAHNSPILISMLETP